MATKPATVPCTVVNLVWKAAREETFEKADGCERDIHRERERETDTYIHT